MKYRNKLISLLLILPLLAVSLAFSGCTDNDYQKTGTVFGELSCTISISGGNSQRAGQEIFKLLEDIDNAVSTSNQASAVYKFNDNNNKTALDRYEISLTAYEMAVKCKGIYEETGGIFNPAVYPLVEAWGVSSGKIHSDQENLLLPAESEIAAYLAYCKYEYLDIIKEGQGKGEKYYIAVKADAPAAAKALKIDFGAYAKGYAADKAVEICKKYKVKYGWVNISGNIILIWTRPDGSDWTVRLENPFKARDGIEYFCRFTAKACSPVSSGVYERYYSINGQGQWLGTKYTAPIFCGDVYVAHIIDPGNGMPVNLERTGGLGNYTYSNIDAGIVNATVFSESSALADAYATVVTVLGMEEGIKFLEGKGLRGIIVAGNGEYAVVGAVPLADESGDDFAHSTPACAAKPGYEFNK